MDVLLSNGRESLLRKIQERNVKESGTFGRVLDIQEKLKAQIAELKLANHNLELQYLDRIKALENAESNGNGVKDQLLAAKDQVIQLQKQLVEQSQTVIDSTKELKILKDELANRETKIAELQNQIEELKKTNLDLEHQMKANNELMQLWISEKSKQDEKYTSLVEKYSQRSIEFELLKENSLKSKNDLAEKMNTVNDLVEENRRLKEELKKINLNPEVQYQRQMQRNGSVLLDEAPPQVTDPNATGFDSKLKEGFKMASKFFNNMTDSMQIKTAKGPDQPANRLVRTTDTVNDFVDISTDNLPSTSSILTQQAQQRYALLRFSGPRYAFECHDGEVNAIRYHKGGNYFATGGYDKKIKLWRYKDGKCDHLCNLLGSNASILCLDINDRNNVIAGSGHDSTCRLWQYNPNRLSTSSDFHPIQTLTGHDKDKKIMGLKFLDETKVVTGSYDKTIKIWTYNPGACIRTLLAPSNCNDLVTLDSQTIISGHYDKKIRFWDVRVGGQPQNYMEFEGKVTSLDVTSDKMTLLASIKEENMLSKIDIRMLKALKEYTHENFRITNEWTRAIFSADMDHQYVCAGSIDGSVIVWNSLTGEVEKVLKEHSASVIAVAWDPNDMHLISTDSKKKAVIWNHM